MKLYAYVMTSDTGFAPNPYWGDCTLATCKPRIRQSAQKGDWVIGTGSVKTVGAGKLVHAMLVDNVPLPLEKYFGDPTFKDKKPIINGTPRQRCGDNLYDKDAAGKWQRFPSEYHCKKEQQEKDIRGGKVLISKRFYYFGRNAVEIPPEFSELAKKGLRGKYNFDINMVKQFIAWLEKNHTPGIHGAPYHNPGCGCC